MCECMSNAGSFSLVNTRNVYNRMQDEVSKSIYISRALYAITGVKGFLKDSLYGMEYKGFYDELPKDRPYYIFGAGMWGWYFSRLFDILGIQVLGFIDNDKEKQGNLWYGRKVFELDAIEKSHAIYIYIANKNNHNEIFAQLIEMGWDKSSILDFNEKAKICLESLQKKQYFDLPYFSFSRDEVFVDAGFCDGSTTKSFSDWVSGEFKEVYCFELDKANYELYKDEIYFLYGKRVKIINKGVWSEAKKLKFFGGLKGSSRLSEDGDQMADLIDLDTCLKDKKVTFIKMDVEGAELDALKGARNLILINRPKLAICIYHKMDDIFTIPQYLLSLYPDYSFALRHYGLSDTETVLYAW